MNEYKLTREFSADRRIPSPEIQSFLRISAAYLGLSTECERLLGDRMQLVSTQQVVRNPRYRARYASQRRRRLVVHVGRLSTVFASR